jgi:hypothetical protein
MKKLGEFAPSGYVSTNDENIRGSAGGSNASMHMYDVIYILHPTTTVGSNRRAAARWYERTRAIHANGCQRYDDGGSSAYGAAWSASRCHATLAAPTSTHGPRHSWGNLCICIIICMYIYMNICIYTYTNIYV